MSSQTLQSSGMTYSTQRRPWTIPIPISPQVATPRNISNASRLSTTHPPLHKRAQANTRTDAYLLPLQPHRTRSLTPQVHRTQLCGNHHHHIQKSERKKQPKTPKRIEIRRHNRHPRRHFIASPSRPPSNASRTPCSAFLLFPELLLLAKKAYSTSENTLFPPLVSKRIQALRCFLCKHLLICMQSLMWKIGNEGMRGMQGWYWNFVVSQDNLTQTPSQT